ncbi:MAG: flavodoxin family protein, partial [Deltaproteobacteria bacterium]|nr:flavodoxin family protein [Deltaproteobacteria bacterium]
LELLWKNCIFDLCGVETFYRETFTVVVTSTSEDRLEWLKKVEEIVSRFFPVKARREKT